MHFGFGVEDLRVELLRDNGASIDEAWAKPRYFGAATALPEEGRTAMCVAR
jgi:hypothetical protein